MRITVLTVFPGALRALTEAARGLAADHGDLVSLIGFNAVGLPGPGQLTRLAQTAADSDVLVLDTMGADPVWTATVLPVLDGFRGTVLAFGSEFAPHVRLGAFRMGLPTGQVGMGACPGRPAAAPNPVLHRDAAHFAQLARAFHAMGTVEADFFLRLLLHHHGGHPELEVPAPPAAPDGITIGLPGGPAHPDVTGWIDEVGAPDDRPVVALVHSGLTYPTDASAVVTALAAALAPHAWIVPLRINTDAATTLPRLREILAAQPPTLVVNLMGFRTGAGPRGGDPDAGVGLLIDTGAPLLHPLLLSRRTAAHWRATREGLGPAEALVTLMLPEMDGCVDEVTIAALDDPSPDPDTGLVAPSLKPLPEQIERFVGRVAGLLRLRRLAAQDKRIALIGYDHPAGEGNLLGAGMLDVAASLSAIMAHLARTGHHTRTPTADEIMTDLLAQAVNSPSYATAGEPLLYPRGDAERDLARPDVWAEVRRAHPDPTTVPMVTPSGDFHIPVVDYGNVLIGIQPGRGPVAQAAELAHDLTRPPHPQYVAFYTWLREVWRPDVIVHIGTHGTLEFLQGKENAVTADCYPDLLIGNVPHVYLYYCGNPAEGLIARRRSHAVLVGYQPPVLRPCGLTDDLAALDAAVADYRRSLTHQPATSEDLLADVVTRAEALHLPTDVDSLERELERTRRSLVPLGLHTFGKSYAPEEARAMVDGMVAHGSFDDAPDTIDAGALLTRVQCNDEWAGLDLALTGRHLDARLGGDPIRDPHVLPTGHNLYQFDARRVPTPLATRRGAEIAACVRSAHRAGHDGAEPSCLGVVLWGLETTRTQGESYAQILDLLGIRPTGARGPGAPRWEIVPAAELGRPRVDVAVTICGFFRDLFPGLVVELDAILAAVAALDEPDDLNPITARTRRRREALLAAGTAQAEAEILAHARIFGPAPGRYGTGLTDVIEDGAWTTTEELAAAFTRTSGHVHTTRHHGVYIEGLHESLLAEVEAVSQTRSSNEYEITDLDHYFEYLGGLGSAVAAARGERVPMLVSDTTQRRIHTMTARNAAASGLRTRLLNPAWSEAMLAHGHRGVTEITDRVTNLLGLAATTGEIDGWMFDDVCARYVADPVMRARLAALNPHSLATLAARLTEAHGRRLWQASDADVELLDDILFDLDGDMEAAGDIHPLGINPRSTP